MAASAAGKNEDEAASTTLPSSSPLPGFSLNSNASSGSSTYTPGWTLEKMTAFWDKHFLFPVLEWLANKYQASGKTEKRDEVYEKYIQYLDTTAMMRKMEAICAECNKPIPEGMLDRTTNYKEEIKKLESSTHSFVKALLAYKKDQQLKISSIAERRSTAELHEWWSKQKPAKTAHLSEAEKQQINKDFQPFTTGVDDEMLRMAKLLYECGQYIQSKKVLDLYLRLVAEFTYEGMSMTKKQSCYWGIACAVIQYMVYNTHNEGELLIMERITSEDVKQNDSPNKENEDDEDKELFDSMGPEVAGNCIIKLSELIESSEGRGTRDKVILLRAWLIHWLLFAFFKFYLVSIHVNHVTPNNKVWGVLPEWLLEEKNIAVILLVAPHLLRYLAVYAIFNRKRKDHFQIVLHTIANAKCKYSDAFTCLLEALFVDFDFDAAQKYMSEVAQSCEEDYFLDALKAPLEEHCRLIIFETYCRIHRSINIDLIAKKVNMSPDAAERWIVNLIRHAKLEAKIDSEKNRVEMSSSPVSLYHQVIERTRNIGIRTSMLYTNLYRPPMQQNYSRTDGGDGTLGGGQGRQDGYKYRGKGRQGGGGMRWDGQKNEGGGRGGNRGGGGVGRYDRNRNFNENKPQRNIGENDAFAD